MVIPPVKPAKTLVSLPSSDVQCVCVCVCGASLVRSLPESVDSGTIVGSVLGQIWSCSPKCPSTTNTQRAAMGIHTWDVS